MFKFELPREQSSIIKVIGVGGGGSNAVNYMFRHQIKGVDFIVCNTDGQSLEMSPVPTRIQLGTSLTQGLGAGAIPEVGRNAAIENIEEIKNLLGSNTKMVFITAGMGGGTGTGAAPVIAAAARELGILTVGIVTIPFGFEGKKRKQQAEEGLENMREACDTLLVINNDKLRDMFGNLTLANAFAQADEVLNTAARGIAEMISVTGLINVDFNDVNTVMRNSGVAIMGSAIAEGENRARVAVEKALASPLLNDNHSAGAKYVLLNITYGAQEVTMDEIAEITDYIQEEAGSTADVIWGHGFDEEMGDKVAVTVIATGFNRTPEAGFSVKAPEKKVHNLNDERPVMITSPISSPTQMNLENVSPPVAEETKTEEPYLKTSNETESNTVAEPVSEVVVEDKVLEEPELKVITVEEKKEEIIEAKEEITLKSEPAQEDKKEETPVVESKPEIIRHWLTEDEESKSNFTNEVSSENPVESKTNSSVESVSNTNVESKTSSTVESKTGNEKVQGSLFVNESKDVNEKHLSAEEQQKRANDRLARIKELSAKLKTPSGLNDLESEPAYMRRNVSLNKTQHSSESNISKYTISDETDENGNKNSGLKSNNSFLHDNVD